ncbi:MAG: TlpA disulfide reductase family protein [Mycetocola sp.]
MTRRLSAAAIGIPAALLLTGCASDPLAEQYKEGSNKGYIAGDGSVTEIPDAERGAAIRFSGTTETGEEISSEDFDGEVLVVNFWYAACAPCRAEAADLQLLSAEYDGKGAQFIGVNVYDQAGTALSFNETYGITYPSILDVNDGAVKLAFTGTVPPKAVPTTIVLDKKGRPSARILGQLKDPSILSTLISDAIDE